MSMPRALLPSLILYMLLFFFNYIITPSSWDSTPLLRAAMAGHLETVRVLLRFGATVSDKLLDWGLG
jgi:hypothetical protein